MNKKPYSTDEQPIPVAEESSAVYGRTVSSRTGRMTVEEYFDEVRRVLHKKYEDVQS